MVRLAFVSDVHLGNHRRFGGAVESSINRRCRMALDVLSAAYDLAVEQECDAFFVLGDLFHSASPLPQVEAEVLRTLRPLTKPACSREMSIHLLVGNHELVSSDVDDHALAALAFRDGVIVHHRPDVCRFGSGAGTVRVVLVPFRPGDVTSWLPGVLERYLDGVSKQGKRILCMHQGISDGSTPAWLRGSHEGINVGDMAKLCKGHRISMVLAGHWHGRRTWRLGKGGGDHIVQLGALVPTGFNDQGLEGYGTIAFWDDGELSLEHIPGPRFVQLGRGEYLDTEKGDDPLIFTEHKPSEDAVRKESAKAADAARSPATLDEAVASFVDGMELPDALPKEVVVQKVGEYLAKCPLAGSAASAPVSVRGLQLTNLLNHEETTLELPHSGLVIVRGPNGAGKSSLVEAVAVACWGKTLRGAPPWREGAACEAGVAAGDLLVVRSKGKTGSPSLKWSDARDSEERTFPTTTKAQAALEAVVGSFDVWRRSHVFSSADAAHFTLASDGERKRMLESVLGLEAFDAALASCRIDLREAKSVAHKLAIKLGEAMMMVSGTERRITDLNAALESLGAQPEGRAEAVAEAELLLVEKRLEEVGGQAHDLDVELRDVSAELYEAAALVRQHRQAKDNVQAGTCPTCLQEVDEYQLVRARVEFERLEAKANTTYTACAQAEADMRADLRERSEEAAELHRRRTDLIAQKEREGAARDAQERWDRAEATVRESLAEAEVELTRLHASVSTMRSAVDSEDAQVAVLEAAEQVLGLRGVRARVLGTALSGLEQLSNLWLAKLHRADLRVRLRPYSEIKRGGTNDAISLAVEGAGGGHGYRGASGGERRRIDVALLFALAEFAAASSGKAGAGTMWFDEVLDALDADGVEAVCDVLAELARDRCVVVITHSDELDSKLHAAVRLLVRDGIVWSNRNV